MYNSQHTCSVAEKDTKEIEVNQYSKLLSNQKADISWNNKQRAHNWECDKPANCCKDNNGYKMEGPVCMTW